ncbi:MAG: hypothetical protein OXF25_09940 [Cyanobacteria bacterium MAG CAR3_bin_5]|nr:hypothetical protein [Cyanobacteria bacterium MAG CAR3_bin_5]
MNAFLAPLLPTLPTASLMLIGLALLWQRVNNLRSDMKDLRSDVKEGFERIERRFDKQQDLILALTDPARQSTAVKG